MALFVLGQLVCTRGVNDAVVDDACFAEFVAGCLKRHATGDWGDLDEQDKKENEFALDKYLRLFSAYTYLDKRVWVITESDRSITTILFPSEY